MLEVENVSPQAGSQWNFVQSSAFECALLGKAGGGKSFGLLLDFLHFYEFREHNGLLLRRTYKDLEDLVAKSYRLYPSLGGKYHEQKHLWTFPSGAHLWFGYLDHDKDIFRYDGWELSWLGIDEINQFSQMPYMFMITRMRCANPNIKKRMRSTAIPNPNAIGTAWVWNRFVKALPEGERGYFTTVNGKDIKTDKENGISRQWFFSRREENRKLMDNDTEYERNLNILPESLKNAYRDGILVLSDEPDQLIKAEWLDGAINGVNVFQDGQKAFGIDYAELGDDKSICVIGRGNQPYEIREWDYIPHPRMALEVQKIFADNGIYQIKGGVDTVGTGAGVYTALQTLSEACADRTNPCRYKNEDMTSKYELMSVKVHFRSNQEAYLWKLAKDFEAGEIDLSLLVTPDHFYENLDLLKQEILALWYRPEPPYINIASSNDLRRAQRVDGRPSLGRSPDRLKALAIWNWCRDWAPAKSLPFDRRITRDYEINRNSKLPERAKAKSWI